MIGIFGTMVIASLGWGMDVVKRNLIGLVIWVTISEIVMIRLLQVEGGEEKLFRGVGLSHRGSCIGRIVQLAYIYDIGTVSSHHALGRTKRVNTEPGFVVFKKREEFLRAVDACLGRI